MAPIPPTPMEFQNIYPPRAMEPTYFVPVSFAVKLLIPLDFVLLPVQALNPELLRPYYPHSLMILSFILQVIILDPPFLGGTH